MKTTICRVYKGDDIRKRVSGGYQHGTAVTTGYWIQIGYEVAFITDAAFDEARKLRSQPRYVEVE